MFTCSAFESSRIKLTNKNAIDPLTLMIILLYKTLIK